MEKFNDHFNSIFKFVTDNMINQWEALDTQKEAKRTLLKKEETKLKCRILKEKRAKSHD